MSCSASHAQRTPRLWYKAKDSATASLPEAFPIARLCA